MENKPLFFQRFCVLVQREGEARRRGRDGPLWEHPVHQLADHAVQAPAAKLPHRMEGRVPPLRVAVHGLWERGRGLLLGPPHPCPGQLQVQPTHSHLARRREHEAESEERRHPKGEVLLPDERQRRLQRGGSRDQRAHDKRDLQRLRRVSGHWDHCWRISKV